MKACLDLKKLPPRELKMYWPQVYLFPIAHACSHKEETTKGRLCLVVLDVGGRQEG